MLIKRIILNIAIVLIIIAIIDFAIGKTLRYFYFKETSGLHFRTTYSIDSTMSEVLVFGSSRSNHSYVPDVFTDSLNTTFYNAGRDGTGIFYALAVLKSVLKRYTPKIIILDISGDFSIDNHSYDILPLLPYYEDHEEIKKIVDRLNPHEQIKLSSQIYPFNSDLLTIVIGNLDYNKKRHSDNKGYVALFNQWEGKIDSLCSFDTYEVDPLKINALKEFISDTKNAGSEIYIAFSPVFLKNYKFQEIDICQEICENEKIPLLNFSNNTVFLNNGKLFADVGHLNNDGAVVFSRLIAHQIKIDLNKRNRNKNFATND